MSADVPRVLIADGDAAVRQQLFSTLLAFDIFSDAVASCADGLARLAEERYGVVVADISLPDVDRIIDRIALMPAAERPVVLVLASNPEAARSLDVEIVQIVLRKPINLSQLADVVRSCVRSARAKRNNVGSSSSTGDYARG